MAEGSFNTPPAIIDLFEFFDRERISGKIGNKSFKGTVGELEPDGAKRKLIKTGSAGIKKVKGGIFADKAMNSVGKKRYVFLGLISVQDKLYRGIKFLRIGELDLVEQAFGFDVFCTEKEELTFFDDMSHIIIGTNPPIDDENRGRILTDRVTVNHHGKSGIFIFLRDRLNFSVSV